MNGQPTPEALLTIIRAHCLECSGGSRIQVQNCEVINCKLWPYRKKDIKQKKEKCRKCGYRQLTLFDFMETRNDKR